MEKQRPSLAPAPSGTERPGRWTRFLQATWRLWAALACFALAALMCWILWLWLCSTKGSGTMVVGWFVCPVYLAGCGLRHLLLWVDRLLDRLCG